MCVVCGIYVWYVWCVSDMCACSVLSVCVCVRACDNMCVHVCQAFSFELVEFYKNTRPQNDTCCLKERLCTVLISVSWTVLCLNACASLRLFLSTYCKTYRFEGIIMATEKTP